MKKKKLLILLALLPLLSSCDFLGFSASDTEDYQEVSYETQYKENPQSYVGNEKILKKGEKGLERVRVRVYQYKGKALYKSEKSRELLIKPEDALIEIGSKERPRQMYDLIWSYIRDGKTEFQIENENPEAKPEDIIGEIEEAIDGTYLKSIVAEYQVQVNSTTRGDEIISSTSDIKLTLRHDLDQEKQVEEWVDDYVASLEGSERDKLRKAYERVITMTSYYQGNEEDIDGISIYSPYCILKNGQGVCHAYASLYQLIAEKIGADSRFVEGKAMNDKGEMEDHAWVEVRIDGRVYGIDPTWGDPVFEDGKDHSDYVNYDYFMKDLSDDHFEEDS